MMMMIRTFILFIVMMICNTIENTFGIFIKYSDISICFFGAGFMFFCILDLVDLYNHHKNKNL